MKKSVRIRIILSFTLLIISAVFLLWFVNKTFLSQFYEINKTSMLGKVFEQVNDIYNKYDETTESDDIAIALERLDAKNNMSLYIFDLYTNGNNIFTPSKYPQMNVFQEELLRSQVSNFISMYPDKAKDVFKSRNSYGIFKIFDKRIGSYYIELYGRLDNDSLIYMRTNFESMKESVAISNKFLAYVGIIVTVLGTLIIFLISKNFTKPILQLSEIATKMSNLDFNAKYEVNREDEIGTLGTSINILSETLEHTISELKSANLELQSDIQKKEEIDQMRKEFLSNVSHELKTPIALIQGYAEGLKENINDDEESRDFYCEVIMDEASKMNKMVKKLLSLNQIEFGNNQINIERFDIVALMKSVLASHEILISQKEVKLYFAEDKEIYVWADEYMVEEVFTNYISNALNHVAYDKVIDVRITTRDNGVVRISVFNTGDNIPVDDLEKIWDKFYKVDKARTREYGGSGIGLSIVKAIMNSLGQNFGVTNYKTGVEFWFELDSQIDN